MLNRAAFSQLVSKKGGKAMNYGKKSKKKTMAKKKPMAKKSMAKKKSGKKKGY
jgi:hypothetical protein